MQKLSQLPAYSSHPEEDKTVRFLYKKNAAKALSEVVKYNRERFPGLRDNPADRIAAEFVAQYLFSHLMEFSLDSLEKETNHRIRKRHDEKYISHKLKLVPGNNLIERISQPPATFESTTGTNTTTTRSVLSPPPKLRSPFEGYQTTTQTENPITFHRKIHIKVKKNQDGKIIEDPVELIKSGKGYDRISKKDQEMLLSTATKTNYNHNNETETRQHHHHKHHHHSDKDTKTGYTKTTRTKDGINQKQTKESLPKPLYDLSKFDPNERDDKLDQNDKMPFVDTSKRPPTIITDFSVQPPTKTISNDKKKKKKTITETDTDYQPQTAYYSQRTPHKKFEDYPDIKPRLKNVQIDALDSPVKEEPNSPVSKSSGTEFAFVARVQYLLQKEVESKERDINALKLLIKEKEREEEKNRKIQLAKEQIEQKNAQPKKYINKDQEKKTKIEKSESKAALNSAHILPSDLPLLSEKENQMLSPKVPPSILRTDSNSLYSPSKKPERLPAIQTGSSSYYYDSYYSD